MEQLSFSTSQKSRSRVIASSGVFQIELLERVGEADYPQLIEISKSLVFAATFQGNFCCLEFLLHFSGCFRSNHA